MITPQEARALRENAARGPWRTDEHPYMDGQSIYQRKGLVIAKHVSGCNADLIVAAPELAELVANLRYEYAVQIPHPHDGWAFIFTDHETDERSMTPHPHWADWEDNLDDARCAAEGVDGARIVRRLVGDVEVVE